jgi:hypothetical protein
MFLKPSTRAGLSLPLSSLSSSLPASWTGKLEWLHVDLGSSQLCTPPTCGGTAVIPFSADVIRLGIDIPLTSLFGGMTAPGAGGPPPAPPASTPHLPAPRGESPRVTQVASLPPAATDNAGKDGDARINSGKAMEACSASQSASTVAWRR